MTSNQELTNLIKSNASEEEIITFTKKNLHPNLFLPFGEKKNNVLFLALNRSLIQFIEFSLSEHQKNPALFDLNLKNSFGNNLLMASFKADAKAISLDLIQYHLKNPKSFDINMVNQENESVLHLLLTHPHNQSVALLTELLKINTFEVNLKNKIGQDAFNAMCFKIKYEVSDEAVNSVCQLTDYIIQYHQHTKRFNLESLDDEGNSSFLNASRKNMYIFEIMLKHSDSFDFYQMNSSSKNALTLASDASFHLLLKRKDLHTLSFLDNAITYIHPNKQSRIDLVKEVRDDLFIRLEKERLDNVMPLSFGENKNNKIKI